MSQRSARKEITKTRGQKTRHPLDKALTEYKQELANWLQSYQWDYFITVTPRFPRKDAIAFMRDVWAEVDFSTDRAFLACEPFKTHYDLHVHGLLFGADLSLPWVVQSDLNHRFGRSRCELARSQSQVSIYCSNYVTKDHRSDNWNFFGDW